MCTRSVARAPSDARKRLMPSPMGYRFFPRNLFALEFLRGIDVLTSTSTPLSTVKMCRATTPHPPAPKAKDKTSLVKLLRHHANAVDSQRPA
ncbi:hypothetical protein NDU88_007361 [Pleurodeles waltl]|uniref:Uncharacterized protein n=1 Tax=Pleurodeles waltl TaxID=8319 RepID=A0AAV7VTE4_PLEWA|nr:hypothetical protein NDU88_007361 [Pleurodeles waltl]